MGLLRSVLLALLLLAAPWPVKGSRVDIPKGQEPATQNDQILAEPDGHQRFLNQLEALLADRDRATGTLFTGRKQAKLNIDAWSTVGIARKPRFTDLAGSTMAKKDKKLGIKFFANFGYIVGERSFVASSEYAVSRIREGYKQKVTKRPKREDFVTIEAFRRVASKSKDASAELAEGSWAAGLYHDLETSQVTLISVGPVGLHFILMEEDPEDGLLKPSCMAEPNTRQVIPLRMTADGSRLRKYYLLVAEEAFLKHAAEFRPQLPMRLSDMKAIIEAGCGKLGRQSPPPILLLISLQDAPLEGENGPVVTPAAQEDDGERPERLHSVGSGPIRDCGHIEAIQFENWGFRAQRAQPWKAPYPVPRAQFSRFCSTIKSLTLDSDYINRLCGIALRSKTLLFSTGLQPRTNPHGNNTRHHVDPDFSTRGGFRRSAKIGADGSAVGAQFNEKGQKLTLARFGQLPLVILVFRETPGGGMAQVVRVLGNRELVELAVESYPGEHRTCEYWLVFVGPSAVERLDNMGDLEAGEEGFDNASDEMFNQILKKLSGRPACKDQHFFAARLRPMPLVSEVAPMGGSPLRSTEAAVALTHASPTGQNSTVPSPILTPTPQQPLAPTESCQVTMQTIQGPQNKVYYVGRQLDPMASHPSAHRCSYAHSDVYVTEDVLLVSRHLCNAEEDCGRRQEPGSADLQPGTVTELFKGKNDTFSMGLDRATGMLHVCSRGSVSLALIRLWMDEAEGMEYEVLSKSDRRRWMRIKAGAPTIYVVVNRNLLPHLQSLVKTLRMPSNEAELAALTCILDYSWQGVAEDPESAVHVALFPVNMTWQDVFTGDEPTDSGTESEDGREIDSGDDEEQR